MTTTEHASMTTRTPIPDRAGSVLTGESRADCLWRYRQIGQCLNPATAIGAAYWNGYNGGPNLLYARGTMGHFAHLAGRMNRRLHIRRGYQVPNHTPRAPQ